jgi:two-component system sensor histidine kinase YesM
MDNFKIKKKLLILYVFCVLLPLILTDSFIIYVVVHTLAVSFNDGTDALRGGIYL